MAGKKQMSRQQRSTKMRTDAGLTQVKVYLDETTLELLALLQENLSEGKMKGDEINMFRSIAVTAGIHSQAEACLGEKVVSDIVAKIWALSAEPAKRQTILISSFSGR